MGIWESYAQRLGYPIDIPENQRRAAQLNRTQERMNRRIVNSLSYADVTIDGSERKVAILDKSEHNIKKIFSMPGETLPHGGLVYWNDFYWLITELNARHEFVQEGVIQQCNHLLRWLDDDDGSIVERWSIIVDGTKYLIGEHSNDLMTIGDARVAVTVAKDEATCKLKRGKRLLIDDPDAEETLAYQITKSNRFFNNYGDGGIFRFIVNEVVLQDGDNTELGIADYYNWAPKDEDQKSDMQNDTRELKEIVDDAKEEAESKIDKVKETGVWL